MNPHDLLERWRSEADAYERDGALVRGDALLRRVADELEAAWREYEAEELTISQAAEESGYSESHLYQMLSEKKIPNAGGPGSPRILRKDLPRKPAQGYAGKGEEFASKIAARRITGRA